MTVDVRVPDIGDFHDVGVIEVLVKPGDTVAVEQSLITIESDKASMEIPSSQAGVVKELRVAVGDKVNEGTLILRLDPLENAGAAAAPASASPAAAAPAKAALPPASAPAQHRHQHRMHRRRRRLRRQRVRLPPQPAAATSSATCSFSVPGLAAIRRRFAPPTSASRSSSSSATRRSAASV